MDIAPSASGNNGTGNVNGSVNGNAEGSERPVSIFGSCSYQGKSMYALESLGCEILEEE